MIAQNKFRFLFLYFFDLVWMAEKLMLDDLNNHWSWSQGRKPLSVSSMLYTCRQLGWKGDVTGSMHCVHSQGSKYRLTLMLEVLFRLSSATGPVVPELKQILEIIPDVRKSIDEKAWTCQVMTSFPCISKWGIPKWFGVLVEADDDIYPGNSYLFREINGE